MWGDGTALNDPATLWALLAGGAMVMALSLLAGRVVRGQVRRAMGLSSGDPPPWPYVDWPRLTGFAAGGTTAALLLMAAASALELTDVSRSLRMVVSVFVHFGLGTVIIAMCTSFAARLPDEVDPSYRTLLMVGGTLVGVAAMSNLGVVALVMAAGIALVAIGSVEDAQEKAGAMLSDLAAGMTLRARRLSNRRVDVGGIEMQFGPVGLLNTQVVEGDQRRPMRNELALALVGEAPSESAPDLE